MTHLTYLEAAVVGLVQGVTELFPVSSLGHNVLIPALVGGSWARDLNVAAPQSPYLAFIVGLHVATAIALLAYFWRDWVRIIGGFFGSLRQIAHPAEGTTRWMLQSADQELAWLIILATIPVGLAGLAFEHLFRVIFGKPVYAAIFLIVNGAILLAGERFVRSGRPAARPPPAASTRPPRPGPARPGRLCGTRPGGTRPGGTAGSGTSRPNPTSGCPRWATAGRSSSGPRRSSPCWQASAGTGSPWWPAWPAACPAKTPPGSPSCSPPR